MMEREAILRQLVTSLSLIAFALTVFPGRMLQGAQKARKPIATWLVFDEEKGFERIEKMADIIDSLSVFGEPQREFIDRCHKLKIEVYRAVTGDASAFDTPDRAKATLELYRKACLDKGYDGIDLDFENLDPAVQDKYSEFLRLVSAGIHRLGKKLSHCVGFYPGMELNPPRKIFYDPWVVAETCDLVRVMCYDMYWAPGRGDPRFADRLDTQGIGPTSSFPWAREAMKFWLVRTPRRKLVMGLPAYSNDYALSPGGRGKQVYGSTPAAPDQTQVHKAWQWYERLFVYLYNDQDGAPRLLYASDAESTKAHLETVDGLGIPAIGFWHFSSVDDPTWAAVREWLRKK